MPDDILINIFKNLSEYECRGLYRESKHFNNKGHLKSYHKSTIIDIINMFPNKGWAWSTGLSHNNGITPKFIQDNILKPWNWEALSLNPNIKPKFIKDNILKPWNWNRISINLSITPELIESYQEIIQLMEDAMIKNYYYCSSKYIITHEFIKKYISEPWIRWSP